VASSEDRQKILLATLAGIVLVFATVWVAYRRVRNQGEEPVSGTPFMGEEELLFPTTEEKPEGLDVVLEAIPGKTWQLPPFQAVIKDPALAESLQQQLAQAPAVPQGKAIATSAIWILTVREDGEAKSRASLMPHLQPIPSRKRGEEPFRRSGLAFRRDDEIHEMQESLETLVRDVVHVWFREAESSRSPLSPLERKKASEARKEYDLLWPEQEKTSD